MAKVEGRAKLDGQIVITLNEQEAAALDALVGYGFDAFIKVFYEHMGKHYLSPHEDGLRSLFISVRNGEGSVASFLKQMQEGREAFNGRKVAVHRPEVERP